MRKTTFFTGLLMLALPSILIATNLTIKELGLTTQDIPQVAFVVCGAMYLITALVLLISGAISDDDMKYRPVGWELEHQKKVWGNDGEK